MASLAFLIERQLQQQTAGQRGGRAVRGGGRGGANGGARPTPVAPAPSAEPQMYSAETTARMEEIKSAQARGTVAGEGRQRAAAADPADSSCHICGDARETNVVFPCGHTGVCATCICRMRRPGSGTAFSRACVFCKADCEHGVALGEVEWRARGGEAVRYDDFGLYGDVCGPNIKLDEVTGLFWQSSAWDEWARIADLRELRCGCPLSVAPGARGGGTPLPPCEGDGDAFTYARGLTPRGAVCGHTAARVEDVVKHAASAHGWIICELCGTKRASFMAELPRFSRDGFAAHSTKGDAAAGFRGHPLCRFCGVRFYDDAALWAHLQQDHFHCHICAVGEAPGERRYFASYADLETHFSKRHFQCEDAGCKAARYAVFPSPLELDAHKSSIHGIRTAGGRQDLTGHLGFRYASARAERSEGGRPGLLVVGDAGGGGNSNGGDSDEEGGEVRDRYGDAFQGRPGEEGPGLKAAAARPRHLTLSALDFPALGAAQSRRTAEQSLGRGSGSGGESPSLVAGPPAAQTSAGGGGSNAEAFPALRRATAASIVSSHSGPSRPAAAPARPVPSPLTSAAAFPALSAPAPRTAPIFFPRGVGRGKYSAYTSLDALFEMTGQGHMSSGRGGGEEEGGTSFVGTSQEDSSKRTSFVNGISVRQAKGKARGGKTGGGSSAGGRSPSVASPVVSPPPVPVPLPAKVGPTPPARGRAPPSLAALQQPASARGSNQFGALAADDEEALLEELLERRRQRQQPAAQASVATAPKSVKGDASESGGMEPSTAIAGLQAALRPLGASAFDAFQASSLAYRKGGVTAREYHALAADLFTSADGEGAFTSLFPVLLASLPEVSRRAEATAVHAAWARARAAARQAPPAPAVSGAGTYGSWANASSSPPTSSLAPSHTVRGIAVPLRAAENWPTLDRAPPPAPAPAPLILRGGYFKMVAPRGSAPPSLRGLGPAERREEEEWAPAPAFASVGLPTSIFTRGSLGPDGLPVEGFHSAPVSLSLGSALSSAASKGGSISLSGPGREQAGSGQGLAKGKGDDADTLRVAGKKGAKRATAAIEVADAPAPAPTNAGLDAFGNETGGGGVGSRRAKRKGELQQA
jgi:hypothetical protein